MATQATKTGWQKATARSWVHAGKAIWAGAFIRGFLGGITGITLVADIVGLQNFEVARVLLVIVTAWSEVAHQLGTLLGHLLRVPAIPRELVTIVVFMSTVTIPALFGLRRLFPKIDPPPLEPRWLWRAMEWGFPFGLGYLFLFGTVIFQGGDLNSPLAVAIASKSGGWQNIASLYVLCIVFQFVAAVYLRPFRFGLLTLLGCLAAAELMYFGPVVGPYVRSWTDQMAP